MRDITKVDIAEVEAHRKRMGSGVAFPYDLHEFEAFRVLLDDADVDKLVMWFEYEQYTRDKSCRVVDSLDSLAEDKRTANFIHGNAAKGFEPADLRTTPKIEPIIVTNSLESSFLYIIDGGHRTGGQQLTKKGFQGVPVYVCVHPRILEWPYVPEYYKKRFVKGY